MFKQFQPTEPKRPCKYGCKDATGEPVMNGNAAKKCKKCKQRLLDGDRSSAAAASSRSPILVAESPILVAENRALKAEVESLKQASAALQRVEPSPMDIPDDISDIAPQEGQPSNADLFSDMDLSGMIRGDSWKPWDEKDVWGKLGELIEKLGALDGDKIRATLDVMNELIDSGKSVEELMNMSAELVV